VITDSLKVSLVYALKEISHASKRSLIVLCNHLVSGLFQKYDKLSFSLGGATQ
jgi:hypothetical protein